MRNRTEDGALSGIEGLAFGVLIFVFGTLMVATAWSVIDAKLATSAGAREAARAYVESTDQGDALNNAQQSATHTLEGFGRATTNTTVNTPDFGRCTEVEVTVSTSITRISLPLIGGTGGSTTVSSSHTEVVDPYRSGLAGIAEC